MANNKSHGGCCGCVSMIITVVVLIALLVAAFFISKYITIDQIGLADTTGILSRFSDAYSPEATFRTEEMADWKVYDILMWIVKSGEYSPQN